MKKTGRTFVVDFKNRRVLEILPHARGVRKPKPVRNKGPVDGVLSRQELLDLEGLLDYLQEQAEIVESDYALMEIEKEIQDILARVNKSYLNLRKHKSGIRLVS